MAILGLFGLIDASASKKKLIIHKKKYLFNFFIIHSLTIFTLFNNAVSRTPTPSPAVKVGNTIAVTVGIN